MASLRDIKRKIRSIKATRQIMYTMKMVASARIKKAQNAIVASRPFAVKMEQLLAELEDEMRGSLAQDTAAWLKPLCEGNTAGPHGLVLVSSDKGMCGPFNSNIFRQAVPWLRERKGHKICVFTVGRKARDFLRSLRGLDMEIIKDISGIFPKAGFAHAEILGAEVLKTYSEHRLRGVTVIYSEFKSMMSQKPVQLELLPLTHGQTHPVRGRGYLRDFSFEPGKLEFLKLLVPRYIKAQFYRVLLESQAAELAARMNAMEAASSNAGALIDDLTLK
ncbi:MAG TPA: ATP synthase F1 subunit gamma, partial [Elusimicrobiales bacterium]|nr:ATP synthase F1 subunit gamma [Elusimicrobiales bacterium]